MALISPTFLYALVLLAVPILVVIAHSFWTQNYLTIDRTFTLENYRVTLTEPIEGTSARILSPAELGATRHLAGAQFIHDQRDALALVASQDGRFTIFKWSHREEFVHAHRVDALLL